MQSANDENRLSLSTKLDNILKQSEYTTSELQSLKIELNDIHELLEAWRQARGLVHTIHTIAKIFMWSTALTTSITIVYFYVKTGEWKK